MSSPCCLLSTATPPLHSPRLPRHPLPGGCAVLPLGRHDLRSRRCRRGRGAGAPRPSSAMIPPMADPWAPSVDSQSVTSQLFAVSLLPYLGFLYFITKSKTTPKLTLFGFYFLLAFVGATIPAGIYAKVHYGTSLSNVDWLHGGAESLLTLTNLFIVLGLRGALRKVEEDEKDEAPLDIQKEKGPYV